MSRSNYDKPFYVDVGTSIVAVRCASNSDVVLEYDYSRIPQMIQLAEDACDRMNKEVEIDKPLRNCDVGTAEEQTHRMLLYCKSHGVDESRCFRCKGCPLLTADICELSWAQMPYEAQEGGAK